MVGGFFLLIPTRDSGFAELMAGHRPNLVNDSGALFRVFKLLYCPDNTLLLRHVIHRCHQ